MYALNFSDDGRILSVTFPEYAPADAVIVNSLPEGDISDYLYINNAYVYDPLPTQEVEMPVSQEERITALEEQLEATKILLGVE